MVERASGFTALGGGGVIGEIDDDGGGIGRGDAAFGGGFGVEGMGVGGELGEEGGAIGVCIGGGGLGEVAVVFDFEPIGDAIGIGVAGLGEIMSGGGGGFEEEEGGGIDGASPGVAEGNGGIAAVGPVGEAVVVEGGGRGDCGDGDAGGER